MEDPAAEIAPIAEYLQRFVRNGGGWHGIAKARDVLCEVLIAEEWTPFVKNIAKHDEVAAFFCSAALLGLNIVTMAVPPDIEPEETN